MDDGSAEGCVANEIDGNDNFRAKRPAKGNRDGIDEGAIEQPAAVDLDWFKNSWKGVGSADSVRDIAFGQPDFMPSAKFGRDRRKTLVEFVEAAAGEFPVEFTPKSLTAEKAHAGKRHVHHAQDTLLCQIACEMLYLLELSGGIGPANHASDGSARDDIGVNSVCVEFEQDADMRPAARGASPKRDTDTGLARDRNAGIFDTLTIARAEKVLAVKRRHLVQLSSPSVSALA